jgi:uncharacterized repeat protein (TIGR01451 family)
VNAANGSDNAADQDQGAFTVQCPDPSISKTPNSQVKVAGDQVSWTITITAGGTGDSTNVVLTDTLPGTGKIVGNWTITGDTAGCNSTSLAPGATLTCTYATIANGGTKSVTITGTLVSTAAACAAPNPFDNDASITGGNDTNSNNNSDIDNTVTVTCPDVSIVKSTTTPTVSAGGAVSYDRRHRRRLR